MPLSTPLAQAARGFAMGAADIVPGVSGGTVALVLGIYERLIGNVHHGARSLRLLAGGDLEGARSELGRVEWLWLCSLLAGILVAVAALSSIIGALLEDHPVRMAALFFGLVAGSVAVAWRLVRAVRTAEIAIMLAVGAALFLLLGLRAETEVADGAAEVVTRSWWVFLLAGAVAICAMILPGISGSFILVMLGMYTEVLGAVNDRDVLVLAATALGCVLGLAVFSSALNWLLHHHHDRVMAAMIGLMLGSLRVLWPWPGGTHSTRLHAPSGDVWAPALLALIGCAVVLGVELVAARRHAAPADTAVRI